MKKLSLLFLCQLFISIAQAQNVGIGTTQPAAQLHVASTDLGDTARGSIIMSRYWLNATDTRASAIYHIATGFQDRLVLSVSGDGGSYSSPLLYSNAKMVIQADGNVGIGTNTPVNKLSVAGNANFTGNVVIGATTPNVSAALDISSTTKGFLPPRMTNVQRDAIAGAVAGLIVWCANCGATGELNVYNGTAWTNMVGNPTSPPQNLPPTVITTAISGITSTSAVSGGNVTFDGYSAVTARGVCWDIATNPTIALSSKTTNGTGTGNFVSNITGLTLGITYYVRAYATNAIGTSYGAEFSFIATPGIGESYQGGIIAYILQPGDPGYIAGQTHGLIAAASDQSTAAQWGCYGISIAGADGTAIGTGNQNTIDIMAGCATAGIAARLCADLVLNGYSDWYLPSKDELNKLYINRVAIGGFASDGYWSSSEYASNLARFQNFDVGFQSFDYKNFPYHVRAVRAF